MADMMVPPPIKKGPQKKIDGSKTFNKISDALFSDKQGQRINEKYPFDPHLQPKDEVNFS